jgi:hypothetical protein
MLSAGNISTNSGYQFLTDSNIAAADTVAGLTSAIDNASAHADQSYAKARFDLAVTLGTYDGSFTDARILSLTTVAGLVGLTNALVTDSVQQQVPE